MPRRCINCGQKPGDKCVYPRNLAEARRWQNLGSLGSFDVDTESLCQHGCVCALLLNTDRENRLDLGSIPKAVGSTRRVGGKASAQRMRPALKRSSFETVRCQPTAPQDYAYPTNNKSSVGMRRQSKQNLGSTPQESSNGDRCNIGLQRCRGAMIQENLYSQMRKNCCHQPSTESTNDTAPRRNLKSSQPPVSKFCPCINHPILRNSNAVPEKSSFPSIRGLSPAPAPCAPLYSPQRDFSNNLQRPQNTNQNRIQQKPTSFDQLSYVPCSQEPFLSSDDFFSSVSTTTGQTRSMTSDNQQQTTPEVMNKCCQACIYCQLKNQEVQCSRHSLHSKRSSTAVAPGSCTEGKAISIRAGCDCYASASLDTKYDRSSSRNMSSTGNILMPNFETGGEDKQYSVNFVNAVNVLLMNGSSQRPYESPNPEICVQESDLADCNERAVFPEVDMPSYRVCRAATSGPNAKDQQDEASVLVLEEDMFGCYPEDKSNQGQSQSGVQGEGGMSPNPDNKANQGKFGDNWINAPGAENITKVLELQRARINELDKLLQQHNMLQQTIQTRMAELQCQADKPATSPKRK
ncbi:hypothetical protein KR054_009722 [Drosophila jambulina]|nr:hypothetical protein KR054_009722 [Drosophila jambulina]